MGRIGQQIARRLEAFNVKISYHTRSRRAEISYDYYPSLKELAELLIELTGSSQPLKYAPRGTATLVRNRIGCPDRAAEEIGFNAETGLREGLARLIAWRAAHKSEVEARRVLAGVET